MVGEKILRKKKLVMDMKPTLELAKELKDALAPLATKIGQTAEYVYGLAVKDVFITGILESVLVLFSVIAFVWQVKFLVKLRSLKKPMDPDLNAFLVTGSLICFVIFLITTGEAVHSLFNPEYVAIDKLIKLVK